MIMTEFSFVATSDSDQLQTLSCVCLLVILRGSRGLEGKWLLSDLPEQVVMLAEEPEH